MVLLIRILRPVAYMLGIIGAMLVVNFHEGPWKMVGWGLIIGMIPFFVAVNVLTSVALAKQKHTRRR